MCGERLCKGIVAFGLTFGLGFAAAGAFSAGSAGAVRPVPPAAERPSAANCVPADGALRYEKLAAEKAPRAEKKTAAAQTAARPRAFSPDRDPAAYRPLVHRERCFEAPPAE